MGSNYWQGMALSLQRAFLVPVASLENRFIYAGSPRKDLQEKENDMVKKK